MKKFVALAIAGAFCVAGQASAKDVAAAQLSGVTGSVMVQQGGKMVAATNTSALRAGDRVVAAKGSAQVKFADGCVVDLKASNMVTVGAKSPCATGAGLVSATQAAPAQDWMTSSTAHIVGYTLVGGGLVWGVVAVANNDNDAKTTSP